MTPLRFDNLQGFTQLPWFAMDGGRLVRRDRGVGPIIDMHSHLALAYVLPMQVDLHRLAPETQHYLPTCCPVELDVYANENFTSQQLAEMTSDLTWRSVTRGGMRATHTIPNLVREMDEMGIAHSVILPIDFPVLSENAHHALKAGDGNPRLISFGSVHPYARNAEDRLVAQVRRGARGVKVHPAVQCVRPDDARAMRLYRACGELRIPVLWHCGPVGIEPRLGRYLSQVRHYERPIAENPHTTFVLGHAGARQLDEALALLNRYPNVSMEVSSQGVGAIRRLLAHGDPNRIMYGTDWPFYHQALALAKVLMATEGDLKTREKVLYGNAARLLRLDA
ncbi:MAG: amidohydrolase family protein [Myxococcota bacterium]